jgi:hypothetical protein
VKRLPGLALLLLIVAAACSTPAVPASTVAAPTTAPTATMMAMATTMPTSATSMPMGTATSGTPMPIGTASAPDVDQTATTATYTLHLLIGPMATMLTMDQAKSATSGEVMVSGDMAMGTSGMTLNHHLEVHVADTATGKVVTDQPVTIKVVDDATKATDDVPIAVMYDVVIGASDTHFGNNVALMPGSDTINVTVGGENATFHVTLK